MFATDCGGELSVEVAVERRGGRPLAPAGGKELFLGSGRRCGAWVSIDDAGGNPDTSGNEAVIGDAIEKPDMPEVGVRRLGLTADAVPA